MSTTTNLDTLKINYLTQAQYDAALADDQINENELYLTPASAAGTYTPTADTTAKFDLSAHMNSTDMTAQELSDFVDSLNPSAINVVDYVIEEGSLSGGLDGSSNYYRKWNSGNAEFWYRRYKGDGLTTAAWSAPIYYVDISSVYGSIWQGVFTAAPTQVLVGSNFSQILSMIPMSWDANGITGLRFITVGAKSNSAYGFSVYAVGRWK